SRAGAELRFGEAASIELEYNGWVVVVGRNRIRAATVLIASGIGGLGTRTGNPRPPGRRPTIMQPREPTTTPRPPHEPEVELHWLRGGYIGVASPRPNECVVALAAHLPPRSNAFEHLRRLNPDASIIKSLAVDAPRRFGARGTAGFPWLPQRLGDRNLLLI